MLQAFVCHLILNAGSLQDHAHLGKQQAWHILFLASFRECVQGFSFFEHVKALCLCTECKMDHIIMTLKLTGFHEGSPDSVSKYQNISFLYVCVHISGNWVGSLHQSCGTYP